MRIIPGKYIFIYFPAILTLLHSDFLSFLEWTYKQFVNVPLKPLHRISKTLYGMYIFLFILDSSFFCEILHFWIQNAVIFKDKSTAVYICWKFRCDDYPFIKLFSIF